MAVKRKAVAKSSAKIFQKRTLKEDAEAEEHEDDAEEQEEVDGASPEDEEQEQDEPMISEEEALAQREREAMAARKKELKTMPVSDLKELLLGEKLETGNKADMVEALLSHESEIRAKERARQAELRDVVVKKKEELEGLSAQAVKELCDAAGIKGMMSKQVRIETLMKQWQAEDGVDKALKQRAHDRREEQLLSMDKDGLRDLCTKAGVDPFVKEMMVERIVKRECELGRFSRPKLAQDSEEDNDEQPAPKAGKVDMVEALLVSEAARKREAQLKKQEAEEAAKKRKDVESMSLDELKKALKGPVVGKKRAELVEAVLAMRAQEEIVTAKRNKLRALPIEDLKQRVVNRGLQPGKNKEAMIDSLFAHEAKLREDAAAYAVKAEEALEKKKAELEEKTASELKELCASKDLKLGLAKQDRIETLLEDIRTNGEVDKIIAAAAKEARSNALLSMETPAVLEVCESLKADPLVKEAMIERVLCHEEEFGCISAEGEDQPKKKKARTSKK